MRDLLDKDLESFETQFNATTHSTSFENETDEQLSVEYNVYGLISSEVIEIHLGGRFETDGNVVTCNLDVKFNGMTAHETRGLQSVYQDGKWNELKWQGF